ncbi:MAG: DUF1697 domain-containing protein [Cyclobacteriaceae bacterium]|nr:DUF1697 domain-containing protein [Cyclobacteriaceae bacterium]
MGKFTAFLRGINVGGHKKVPMQELKITFEKEGFRNVKTLLASGNVVFEGNEKLTENISGALERDFGFLIRTIILPFEKIPEIVNSDPFKEINLTPDIRLYVTFLREKIETSLKIPYRSDDCSFQIIRRTDIAVFSVLDLEKTKTTDAMKILDTEFGLDITTRNYNTVVKIAHL